MHKENSQEDKAMNDEYFVEKQKIGKRLMLIGDRLGFRFSKDFAEFLSLSKGTYSSILTGRNALSFKTLMKLANRQVNFNYLFYGLKGRSSGIIITKNAINTANEDESEGLYIERIQMLEQQNEHLKEKIKAKNETIESKNLTIKLLMKK